MKHFSLLIISIILNCPVTAQKGFKTTINIHPAEPNAAYQVQECDNTYILSGQYFDSIEGYWLPFVAEFDINGNLIHRNILANDTTYGLNLYDRSFCNSDSYIFTGKSSIQAIFKYDLKNKSIEIIDRFNFTEFDIGPSSFLVSENLEKRYYCGRNISTSKSEVAVIMLSELDTIIFRHRIAGKNLIARNMRFNSEGNIIVAAETSDG